MLLVIGTNSSERLKVGKYSPTTIRVALEVRAHFCAYVERSGTTGWQLDLPDADALRRTWWRHFRVLLAAARWRRDGVVVLLRAKPFADDSSLTHTHAHTKHAMASSGVRSFPVFPYCFHPVRDQKRRTATNKNGKMSQCSTPCLRKPGN